MEQPDFIKLGPTQLVRIDAITQVYIDNKGYLNVVTDDVIHVLDNLEDPEAGYEQIMQYLNVVEELV
jgi:hypothetical protein